jgi:DNA-binding MarR family transcriptional regulator
MDTSLLFDVFALNQAVGRLLARAMADGPLSPRDYAIYSAIFELEAVPPTVLAGRLGMPLTTLMDVLADLDRRGHASRIPNPRDGRSYLVTLTGDGLAAHRGANRRFEIAHAAFSDALPDESTARTAFAEVRRAVETAIRRLDGAPGQSPDREMARAT